MNNKLSNDISKKEFLALKAIEKLIGKPLEKVDQLTVESSGYKLDSGRIIEIGLIHLGLTRLPPEFEDLEHLQVLYLEMNNLNELPEFIGNLRNLKILDLRYNRLVKLPETIGNLIKLEVLILDNNQLEFLPETIGKLIKLRSLQLNGNRLSSLPDSIGKLANLTVLAIAGNNQVDLPSSLGNLEKLKVLMLDQQQPGPENETQQVLETLGAKDCRIMARKVITPENKDVSPK
ncbi:MAG: leucine-rich repeat domain-containing protein [Candidatus Odinarchaeota archaeon]